MIYYITTKDFANTMQSFLGTWGNDLRHIITPINYEKILHKKQFSPGTYIFSDIERLPVADLEAAAQIHKILSARDSGCSVLNHPLHSMKRFELLRSLFENDINNHNVHPLIGSSKAMWKYPIFIRVADDHGGALSPLLHSEEQLEDFFFEMDKSCLSKEGKIVIEFCDCGDAKGVYKKYSAFFIAGDIIPRHICFGKDWQLKEPDIIKKHYIEEESKYLSSNPHQQMIQQIFKIARIDYGRIDYGIRDNQVQVWEINTNPRLASVISSITPERDNNTKVVVANLIKAFQQIDQRRISTKRIKNTFRKKIIRRQIVRFTKRTLEPIIFSLPVATKWKINLRNTLIILKNKQYHKLYNSAKQETAMSHIQIRKMTDEDIPAAMHILKLWNMAPQKASNDVPDPERSTLDLSNSFVAVKDGNVIGVCSYIVHSSKLAETASLAVDPAMRGLGVGYQLQEKRLEVMKKAGYSTVRTETDRPETIQWYIKYFNYKIIGTNPKKHPFSMSEIDHWTVLEKAL